MSKKVIQKIKEMLKPEDLKVLETAIQNMVKENVAKKVTEQVALREAELKKEYSKLSEEFVEKELASRLVTEKAKLVESYDKMLVVLENKIALKLDSFLESTIMEQISDEMLGKIAINEALLPLVNNLKEAFAKHYVDLDSTGERKIKELNKTVEVAEKELNESINKNMEYEERLEKAATFVLISQKTAGLTESQKVKVVGMFKDKKFEEVNSKVDDYINILKEGVNKIEKKKVKVIKKKKNIEKIIIENDNVVPKKKKVVKDADINNNDKVLSIEELANNFLPE